MKKAIALLFMFLLVACDKADLKLCLACVINQTIFLKTATTPQIFLIHNISNQTILLNHETNQPMSAGWVSQLDPQQWSAIVSNQNSFQLSCSDKQWKTIVCKTVVRVYKKENPQPLNKADGSFWLAENIDKKAVTKKILSY